MNRRSAVGALCATLGAGGIAALVGATAVGNSSPYLHALLWFGIIACAVGFGGLVLLAIIPEKKSEPPTRQHSRTAHATGGGRIELEDSYSTADTFADAEEGSKVAAKRIIHGPAVVRVPRPNRAAGENADPDND